MGTLSQCCVAVPLGKGACPASGPPCYRKASQGKKQPTTLEERFGELLTMTVTQEETHWWCTMDQCGVSRVSGVLQSPLKVVSVSGLSTAGKDYTVMQQVFSSSMFPWKSSQVILQLRKCGDPMVWTHFVSTLEELLCSFSQCQIPTFAGNAKCNFWDFQKLNLGDRLITINFMHTVLKYRV